MRAVAPTAGNRDFPLPARRPQLSWSQIVTSSQRNRELARHEVLGRRLAEIEKGLLSHDLALRDLCQKIRPLLLPPLAAKRREIGFHVQPEAPGSPKGRKP